MRESRFGADLDNRISVNPNKKAFVVAPLTGNDCDTFQGPKLVPIGGLDTKLISHLHRHAAWIKNRIFTCSLNTDTTPYQAYFGKKPSLAMLQLFGCKAYAHTPKVDQTKFGERTIECIHIGFAEEKKAYLLYSREHRKIFELRDVEFEEIEGCEWVTVNSDSDDEGVLDAPNTGNGDPEREHTVDAPSTPVEEVDHQEVQKTTPDTHTHPSGTQPAPLHRSTHSNKCIPQQQQNQDPKLAQRSS